MMGIESITVRFFIYDPSIEDEFDCIVEVDEVDFIEHQGNIDYERHTMFENGCNQICLTKGLPQC